MKMAAYEYTRHIQILNHSVIVLHVDVKERWLLELTHHEKFTVTYEFRLYGLPKGSRESRPSRPPESRRTMAVSASLKANLLPWNDNGEQHRVDRVLGFLSKVNFLEQDHGIQKRRN
jgi:hypothetical protein